MHICSATESRSIRDYAEGESFLAKSGGVSGWMRGLELCIIAKTVMLGLRFGAVSAGEICIRHREHGNLIVTLE